MREARNIPTPDGVARITLGAGHNMVTLLAGCRCTVMAGIAGLGYTLMGEVRYPPVAGCMTSIALIRGFNVPC